MPLRKQLRISNVLIDSDGKLHINNSPVPSSISNVCFFNPMPDDQFLVKTYTQLLNGEYTAADFQGKTAIIGYKETNMFKVVGDDHYSGLSILASIINNLAWFADPS